MKIMQCQSCDAKLTTKQIGKKCKFCSLKCSRYWSIKNCPQVGFQKGSRPNISRETYNRFKIIRKGKGNPAWKENPTKTSLHCWVRSNFIRPPHCELCGTTTAKKYDWSNKEHDYKRDRDGWWNLCRTCHMKYDINKFGPRYGKNKQKD